MIAMEPSLDRSINNLPIPDTEPQLTMKQTAINVPDPEMVPFLLGNKAISARPTPPSTQTTLSGPSLWSNQSLCLLLPNGTWCTLQKHQKATPLPHHTLTHLFHFWLRGGWMDVVLVIKSGIYDAKSWNVVEALIDNFN